MCDLHDDTTLAELHRQEALDDVALLALELGYDVDSVDPKRAQRVRKRRELIGPPGDFALRVLADSSRAYRSPGWVKTDHGWIIDTASEVGGG